MDQKPNHTTPLNPEATILSKLKMIDEVISMSDEGLWAFDRDLHIIYWNKVMERIVGFTAEQVIGQDILRILPFLTETSENRSFQKVLEGEDVISKNQTFSIPETNREVYVDACYLPLRQENSAVYGGIAVVRDFTAQKIFEDQAKETETRFVRMADTAPVLLWMSGLDSTCIFFNQSWLKFTGRTMEQELGVGWAEGVHPEDFQECMDTFSHSFKARREFEMEYRLRRYDGEYRWILDRGAPRFGPSRKFAGFIGSCIDITERRELEKDLRRAITAREEFISIASHELRTPLTSLKLQLQMLKMTLAQMPGKPLNLEKAKVMIDVSERQVMKLVQLVQDLLDLNQLQKSGRGRELVREKLSLKELTQTVLDRVKSQINAAGCEVELTTEADPVGLWDRGQLDQVIVNLLMNAAKYGSRNKINIKISQSDNMAILTVQDRGIGIQKKDLTRIFDQYVRAVSSDHYGGLGLGLYIVHQIVEAHGGKVSAQSEFGKGSLFIVELQLT